MFFLFFQDMANCKDQGQDRKDRKKPLGRGIVQKSHGAIHKIYAKKGKQHHCKNQNRMG